MGGEFRWEKDGRLLCIFDLLRMVGGTVAPLFSVGRRPRDLCRASSRRKSCCYPPGAPAVTAVVDDATGSELPCCLLDILFRDVLPTRADSTIRDLPAGEQKVEAAPRDGTRQAHS